MGRATPRWSPIAAACALAVAPVASARAQGIGSTCATSYERAQELERAGALLESRAELRQCIRACPTKIGDDCRGWLADIERELPSVVLSIKRADGSSAGPVRVLVDGAPFVASNDGEVEIDPGRHTFSFEDERGARTETHVDLTHGARAIEISVRFPAPLPEPETPTAAIALLGAGVAGLGTGAALGIVGHLERSALRDTCAPTCAQGDIDAIATKWMAGGIAAGVGALLVGLAVVVYLEADEPGSESLAPTVTLSPSASSLSLSGRF